jgi:hypothetical protein
MKIALHKIEFCHIHHACAPLRGILHENWSSQEAHLARLPAIFGCRVR